MGFCKLEVLACPGPQVSVEVGAAHSLGRGGSRRKQDPQAAAGQGAEERRRGMRHRPGQVGREDLTTDPSASLVP